MCSLLQPEIKLGDGPIGIICVPTRELALQIYTEAKKYAKLYNLTVVCAYGGGSMWEQQKACEAGCELLVCTPVSVGISLSITEGLRLSLSEKCQKVGMLFLGSRLST